MDKNIQLFCDTDASGKITRMLSGERIIPVSSYQYFFMIDKKEQANLDKYRVENGQLVQIDGTTLIEVENPNPSTEEQLSEVKRQLANMQKILDALTTPPTPTVPEEPPAEEPTDPVEEPPTEEPPVEEEPPTETEPTPEEPPVEPEPTEPPTGEEEPPTEEPPVEEPVEEPATDEPTEETPVEEPTNPTE